MMCSRVPVLHEVRDITVSQSKQFVLVSYENKVSPVLISVAILLDELAY